MTIPLSVASSRAALSYDQLKRLTKESGAPWPTLLIRDYQGIGEDTTALSTEIDAVRETVNDLSVKVDELDASVIELTERVVAVEVAVDDLSVRVTSLEVRTSALESDVLALEAKEIKTIPVTSDYTAEPYKAIICRNTTPINITLNPTPALDEVVNIKRTDEVVNVLGIIDGLTDWVLNVKGYSMKLIFNGTDWSEI